MAMLHYIVQSNYAILLFCMFLLVFCLAEHSFEKRVRGYFILVILLSLVLTVVDSIDFYIEKTVVSYSLLRCITTAVGYTLRPLSIFFVICIFRRRHPMRLRVLAVFLYINGFIALASIRTEWVYFFDTANQFHRGPLWMIPFLTSIFYLLLMAGFSLRGTRRNGGTETILVFFIVLAAIVGTMLESIFHFKFMLNAAMTCGVCAYYLFLHVQLYKRDSLTGLLNRRNFYLALQDCRQPNYILIAVDINNLKTINDTLGHSQGDVCITTVVDVVESSLPRGCTMYRTGGDEFMIICRGFETEQAKEVIEKIQKKLEATEYSASFGWARYEVGESYDSVCNRADAMMYDNKRQYKRMMQISGN